MSKGIIAKVYENLILPPVLLHPSSLSNVSIVTRSWSAWHCVWKSLAHWRHNYWNPSKILNCSWPAPRISTSMFLDTCINKKFKVISDIYTQCHPCVNKVGLIWLQWMWANTHLTRPFPKAIFAKTANFFSRVSSSYLVTWSQIS